MLQEAILRRVLESPFNLPAPWLGLKPVVPAPATTGTCQVSSLSAMHIKPDAQHRQLEKAYETLINIASVSKRLHTALAGENASLHAVSARSRLDKIVIASGTILTKSLENDLTLDPRLEVWLCSREPDMCLHILSDMERSIVIDRSRTSWWGKISSAAVHMSRSEDKVNEALKLFNDRQDFFHFLLTPEVW